MTSIIKVDNLQNQCGANIISESSNVITIGASGDTVTLAAGASQSGFGRSGSVNWDTTPKTTTPITSVSGNGYFINTTSIAITVNLPATPAAGDIVAIADYANTSATNNITVGRNGSKIDGETIDAKIKINGQVYTLVYVDATEGWKTVGQTFNQITTAEFVAATGGCIVTSGDFKIHTFTGPGTFTVTNAGNAGGSTTVDYLVVAGGGGGGGTNGGSSNGGGGAGGFRQSFPNPATAGFPISVTAYPITVGGGGAGQPGSGPGTSGIPSIFSTITSTGGGGGGGNGTPIPSASPGLTGGSGGGGGAVNGTGGAGNTPPTSPSQGNPGGNQVHTGTAYGGGGGGGASTAGSNGSGSVGGNGGSGTTSCITASPTIYAGGGGGGADCTPISNTGQGGPGGGGRGAYSGGPAVAGTANRGGGGGGQGGSGGAAAGGSGVVVIRYKFQ
jgi:hypothetical protein